MKRLLMVSCAMLAISGCASLNQGDNNVRVDALGHTYQDYVVDVTSNPPGAKIEWNGECIGTAPLQRVLKGYRGMAAPAVIKAYSPFPGARVMVRRIPGNEPIPRTIDFDWNK